METNQDLYNFMKVVRSTYPDLDWMVAYHKANAETIRTGNQVIKLDKEYKNIKYTYNELENEVLFYEQD